MDPSTPPARAAHMRGAPWVVVAVVAVAASGWFEIADGDVWWHIAIGRWLVERGPMPTHDPFSHSSTGSFNYYEPIADVYFYVVHRAGGVLGLLFGKLALIAAIAAAVAALARSGGPVVAAAIVLLFGAAAHQQLLERPYLFSFLFFALLLVVARRIEAGAGLRWLAAFPVVLAVWGNCHRSTLLGFGLYCACAAALVLDPARRRGAVVPVVAAGLVSVAALTANPAGMYGLTSSFAHVAGRQFDLGVIEEWALTDPAQVVVDVPAIPLLCALWLFDRWRRRKLDVEALAFTFALVLAHRARFLPFLAIASAPGAARALAALVDAVVARAGGALRPGVAGVGVVVAALAMLGVQYVRDIPPYARAARIADRIPVDLAAFVAAAPPPGRMWNEFDLGGYLVYALAPGIPVFIDGRIGDEHYPPAFLAETLRAPHDDATLQAQLARFDIGFAVVSTGEGGPLPYAGLHRDPGWALVYWDDVGAVVVQRTPASADYLARHAYAELRIDTVGARIAGLAVDPRKDVLLAELDRNVAEAPRSVRARYTRAQAWRIVGDARYAAERDAVVALAALKGLNVPPP